jgi:hypothetical protein
MFQKNKYFIREEKEMSHIIQRVFTKYQLWIIFLAGLFCVGTQNFSFAENSITSASGLTESAGTLSSESSSSVTSAGDTIEESKVSNYLSPNFGGSLAPVEQPSIHQASSPESSNVGAAFGVVYNNEAQFLAASPSLSMESFEGLAATNSLSTYHLSLANFNVTVPGSTDLGVWNGATGWGGHATDGVKFVGYQSAANETLTIDFVSPITHFGINITDWGDYGSGSLIFSNNAGDSTTIAVAPRANDNELFFGIINTGTPFSQVKILNQISGEGYCFDEIYYTGTGTQTRWGSDFSASSDTSSWYWQVYGGGSGSGTLTWLSSSLSSTGVVKISQTPGQKGQLTYIFNVSSSGWYTAKALVYTDVATASKRQKLYLNLADLDSGNAITAAGNLVVQPGGSWFSSSNYWQLMEISFKAQAKAAKLAVQLVAINPGNSGVTAGLYVDYIWAYPSCH